MIDLRSDTVTKPCDGMRQAMASAEVGDDVFNEDQTVNLLQDMIADMLGKEASIFVPSGTQANLLALLSHCERGEECIVGQQAHTYKYEAGGAAVLGGIQPQPIDFEPDGHLDLEKVKECIKPDDPHFAKTKILCLENTVAGKILPLKYLSEAREFCNRHKLRLHLDGARAFNASVELGVDIKDIAAPFDTITICLSKGLGAPIGSLLAGDHETISRARRWRKMLGGGMRQAGIIAAAGIFALNNNISRLKEDHENARLLAESLAHIEELAINLDEVQTNMVFINAPRKGANDFAEYLRDKNILISPNKRMRLTTHLDVSKNNISEIIQAVKSYF